MYVKNGRVEGHVEVEVINKRDARKKWTAILADIILIKSDPFLVVHQHNPKANQWIELFRTETIQV